MEGVCLWWVPLLRRPPPSAARSVAEQLPEALGSGPGRRGSS